MSSPSTAGEVQGLCGYYARAGYFRHIQTACADFFKRKPAPEPALVFWRAFGAMREGSINESIADLNTLRREGELQYAVLFALAHAHNLSKVIDTDEVFRLEAALAKEAARAGERGLWLAAQFAWHVGRTDDALELADKLAALKPGAAVGQVLKCWLQLATGGAHDFAPAAWDECGGKNELDTLLGKAAHLEALGAPDKALDVLNQLIVLYGWFTPALAEKARLLAATNDWEQAVETAQRLLGLDGRSIDGLRLVALHALAYEGNAAKAAARIGELTEAVDRLEPKNPALCAALAKPLARVAGGNSAVLRLTQGLIDRACRLAPFATEHVLEKAYEHALAGDFKAAAAAFREANGLDASDMTAVLGQIRCQVEGGAFAAAQTQLEFAAELSEALGPTADLAYVSALVAARHRLDRVEAARHLDRAVELHRPALDGARRDAAAYAELRPDFLIEVAAEFLRLVDGDERGGVALEEGSAEAAAVAKATRLLELVRKLAPGLLAGQMLLARARYFLADLDGAVRMLAHCAKLDASYAPASLLHAQILLQQEQPKAAMAVLEAALAHDFTVRDSLLYNLVRARSLAADGEHADALEVLRGALRLPAVRDGLAPAHERCSVHLQTVDALLRLERNDDAGRAMGEAIALFAGTEQEGRITVANCELLLAKGDVTGAMSILRAVGQASPNYTRAKRMLADLYLTHRNDRRLFCECYEELARSAPSVSTLVALGEAYLSVQEPEKAIPAFERARERAPHDTALAVRIGRAHASTHDYLRAVEYYEGALARDPSQSALSLDFARLYHRLHKQELARGVLEGLLDGAAALGRGAAAEAAAAEASDDERGALELGREVAGWQLYAQVLKAQAEPERAVQAQLRAKQTQQRLVARTVADAPDALPEQRAALCAVGLTLAQLLVDARQSDRAVEEVEDALRQQPADAAATLALAKLHLQRGETDLCQRHCASLMRADTDNLEASLMLADLMLRKADYDSAIFHFEQLLEKAPANYLALRKLIVLLRHAGRLTEAKPFVERAQASHARASSKIGLHFCAGLLARYLNVPHEALAHLNRARKDGEWGEAALCEMAAIYIGADSLIAWSDGGGAAVDQVQEANLKAADALLSELKPSRKKDVLVNLVVVARRSKREVEPAIRRLEDILKADPDYVPALTACALAQMTLKQDKARNLLKQVAKMSYQPEFADELELGWLLLAHVYVQKGQFDTAQGLCERCLAANRSCARAYELIGTMKEKQSAFAEAAEHYKEAWLLSSEAAAPIGFKLAFNLLKAQEYVSAIDVCHKVLKAYPDYPKIKAEIMDKARASLRTGTS